MQVRGRGPFAEIYGNSCPTPVRIPTLSFLTNCFLFHSQRDVPEASVSVLPLNTRFLLPAP